MKNNNIYVTFSSTTTAMIFERIIRTNHPELIGRLIPIPSHIKSGCGICWTEDISNQSLLLDAIRMHALIYDKILY